MEASNVGTGVSRQANTDERGVYLFNNVQAGTYKVTVTANGFKTVVQNDVGVNANEVRRVDVALQIARPPRRWRCRRLRPCCKPTRRTCTRRSPRRKCRSCRTTAARARTSRACCSWFRARGSSATREANSEAGNPQRAQTLFMNGVSSTGNSTKLDGATVSYPWLPVNIAYVPPSEAIETVNISTNSFDAEQGAAGGAAVNVSIKSGTNQLHGVAVRAQSEQQHGGGE